MNTQPLQQELNERWLTLDVEAQECVISLLRIFTGERGLGGLSHYQEALRRQDRELAERYTRFGELKTGDIFLHFGRIHRKTEPTQVLQWVNCESDRGQTFMGDDYVVERVESQDTQDRTD